MATIYTSDYTLTYHLRTDKSDKIDVGVAKIGGSKVFF